MSFITADRVKETTTTTGTGNVTLAGAVSQFKAFSAVCANGDTFHYAIVGQTGTEWEVGLGTYVSATPAVNRTTVLASSNSNAAVSFSAGTKDVFITIAADTVVSKLGDTMTGTLNGTNVAYFKSVTMSGGLDTILNDFNGESTNAFASGGLYGLQFHAAGNPGGGNTSNWVAGMTGGGVCYTGNATNLLGGFMTVSNENSGTVASARVIHVQGFNNSTGVITALRLFHGVDADNGGGGTITTQYGLYLDSLTTGTTNYAIYTNDGLVHFGDKVELAAPVAGNATLNFPAGTAPTTPNDGDVWYDGKHLYARIDNRTTYLDDSTIGKTMAQAAGIITY